MKVMVLSQKTVIFTNLTVAFYLYIHEKPL